MLNPANFLKMTRAPWRLCPELNAYPDGQCKVFLDRALPSRSTGSLIALGIAATLGLVVFLNTTLLLEHLLLRNSRWLDTHVWQGRVVFILQAIVMFSIVAAVAPIPYIILLRRGVRGVLDKAVCPKCRYSLQGLTIADGRVQCPECGSIAALADLGLSEESLALGRPLPDAAPIPANESKSSRLALRWILAGCLAMIAWLILGFGFLALAALIMFFIAVFGESFRTEMLDAQTRS